MQVYIRPRATPELPEILFLLLFSLNDAYSFQRRLSLLERRDARAPDAVALSCGVATLLQQFHPSYAEVTPEETPKTILAWLPAGSWCTPLCASLYRRHAEGSYSARPADF